MGQDHTKKQDRPMVPVRTLVVRVIDGPNKGIEHAARDERLTIGSAKGNALELSDPSVSRFHVELRPVDEGVHLLDQGSTNGTYIGEARIESAYVPTGTEFRIGETRLVVSDGGKRMVPIVSAENFGAMHGRSEVMRKLFGRARKAALSNVNVLLLGESGTGKELLARGLHDQSPRSDGPFVVVDCGSLTPTLIASELFGHERGAFTGAIKERRGAIERAAKGTLFIDELGELPAELQPMLLGLLERRRFRRLGGDVELEADVRVVSATHRDLRKEVNAGGFRLDLFYRLAVVSLELPPLRERPEDIPLLIERFLGESGAEEPRELLSSSDIQALATHRFEGNVRELRNIIEAAVAMGEPPMIPASGGDRDPAAAAKSSWQHLGYSEARQQALDDFDRHYLSRLLEDAGDNVSEAARRGRMNRSHLNTLLKRLKLR